MTIRQHIRRVWQAVSSRFRKKPVYVTRHIWSVATGCEIKMVVPQGKVYPGMRLDEILADMQRGVKFSRGDMDVVKASVEALRHKENGN